MNKTIMYQYFGTNGTILSPIHLEDIYYVRKVRLIADVDKKLTCDGENFYLTVTVPEEEVELWREV